MKKAGKAILHSLLSVALCVILTAGVKIALDGCWLVIWPIDEKILSVMISYPDLSADTKEITSADEIKRCANMLNFLNYDIFKQSQDDAEPLITYTYHMKDGTDMVVAANNDTVFYKGEQHVLKKQGLFVNLTEGLFFQEEMAGENEFPSERKR